MLLDFIYKVLQLRRQLEKEIALPPTGTKGLYWILKDLEVMEGQNLSAVLHVQEQRVCTVAHVQVRENSHIE